MNPWDRETLDDLANYEAVDRWLTTYEKRIFYKVATTTDILNLIEATKGNPIYRNMMRNYLSTENDRSVDSIALVRSIFWNRLGWRYTDDLLNIWVINRKNPYHKGK